MPFIERAKRKVLYTDFTDELAEAVDLDSTGVAPVRSFEQFRRKARAFLRAHEGAPAIEKLRRNGPIAAGDLVELEQILVDSGVGSVSDIGQANTEAGGFGLFIRSLVGLDRTAAKEALAGFIDGRNLTADQHEFVELVVNDLTENGVVPAARFYDPPYTELAPTGPEGLFAEPDVEDLLATLDAVRRNAEVA